MKLPFINPKDSKMEKENKSDKQYMASQWGLMYKKLKKHKLARISMVVLGIFYFLILFGQFVAPQGLESYDSSYMNCPPTAIHWVDSDGNFHLRPFVYGIEQTRDPETFQKIYKSNTDEIYPLHFFVRGEEYRFLGLFKSDIHLFCAKKPGSIFLFGTDGLGRDMFSRIVLGGQISLTVPLVGVSISFIIGLIVGSISGYFGGIADFLIQRLIEVMKSFPSVPLWMALSAAIPPEIPVVQMYLFIIIILSFKRWTGLARVVRGKFISLRNEDFVMAAKVSGVKDIKIIATHLIPGFISYLIVNMTLGIPGMIIGETSMSFLGLGIRPPATSWGVLLKEAQQIQNVATYPWKLIPLLFVVIAVLSFNFLGDGLRDAADPYK